jgi:hypothetical protein
MAGPGTGGRAGDATLANGAELDGIFTYTITDITANRDPKANKGGQGKVYQASVGRSDSDELTYYAVKAAGSGGAQADLRREAEVMFALDPARVPHLALLNDVVRHPKTGQALLVTEWAEKGSLRDWLGKQPSVPFADPGRCHRPECSSGAGSEVCCSVVFSCRFQI